MNRLREVEGVAALALRFLLLTASRSGETRHATWTEIDLEGAVWAVPGPKMKSGIPHRQPLSPAALAALREVLPLREGPASLVFPGARAGRPLSDVSIARALVAAGGGGVVHGLRTSFRTWAAENTSYPHEVCEAALAHVTGSAVSRAYARSDLLERRRELMCDWAAYCGSMSR